MKKHYGNENTFFLHDLQQVKKNPLKLYTWQDSVNKKNHKPKMKWETRAQTAWQIHIQEIIRSWTSWVHMDIQFQIGYCELHSAFKDQTTSTETNSSIKPYFTLVWVSECTMYVHMTFNKTWVHSMVLFD